MGDAAEATPLEIALVDLVRRAHTDPAGLAPIDLDPIERLVGEGGLEYLLVLCSFHCITRVADLVGAEPEMPAAIRRFEILRRVAIRVGGFGLRLLGLTNDDDTIGFDEAIDAISPVYETVTGRAPENDLHRLRPRPQLVEMLQLILEEQHHRSSLGSYVLSRVHHLVEAIIEAPEAGSMGLTDPIDVFIEIGTRHPYRATEDHIAALRAHGLDDLAILDLAIAIADSNAWARYHRLLGLDPEIYYVSFSR